MEWTREALPGALEGFGDGELVVVQARARRDGAAGEHDEEAADGEEGNADEEEGGVPCPKPGDHPAAENVLLRHFGGVLSKSGLIE